VCRLTPGLPLFLATGQANNFPGASARLPGILRGELREGRPVQRLAAVGQQREEPHCRPPAPEFAAEYLRAALEDDDEPSVLLIALRRIAEARGGLAMVAKAAGIERESLYRALSVRGNPRLSTLVAVTKAVGLKLTVEEAQ